MRCVASKFVFISVSVQTRYESGVFREPSKYNSRSKTKDPSGTIDFTDSETKSRGAWLSVGRRL